MRHRPLFLASLLLGALLAGCGDGDEVEVTPAPPAPPPPPAGARGDLIDPAPPLVATYTPEQLATTVAGNDVAGRLVDLILAPECTVHVHQLRYLTVDPQGNLTPASGALMVPGGAGAACEGERPVLLYAHGTSADKTYNMANLDASDEALLVAAVFAAQGHVVVAPNYVGYDSSTLGYHPYLNADQQSADMIDALAASRSAVPVAAAPATSDGARLFITGYSQGGHVAMATHRALQAAGVTVTASAPMSGPYALAAFGDALFQGQVTYSAPLNLALLITGYQAAYGNLYTNATDVFAPAYADTIQGLLPSTVALGDLESQGRIPRSALFDPNPPDPSFAAYTPATTPANLATVFATGFGADALLTNAFRLAYLVDARDHPDGGFPVISDGLPSTSPANALRQALKRNDLRGWTPASPVLLCAGNRDPSVLYLNTALMQNLWSANTQVSVLDIDSEAAAGDSYARQKTQFALAKELVELSGGDETVLREYHAGLVAPFCLSAVKSFFDGAI